MRRVLRWAGWLIAGLAALVLVLWVLARPPAPGAFYAAAGSDPGAPGRLLHAEPIAAPPPGMEGWRILYSTTRGDGAPVTASGYVMIPAGRSGPVPLVAWAHGTTGIMPGCAPSLAEVPGSDVPALASFAEEGWALVATDYPGLGTEGPHAYLEGPGAARAVLDSIRAARGLKDADLSGPLAVWGHSQGGHAAIWSGIAAPSYAPELRLAGVAALAPATDLPELVARSGDSLFGKITGFYFAHSLGRMAPDSAATAVIRPAYRLLAGDVARRCVTGKGALFSVAEVLLMRGPALRAAGPDREAFDHALESQVPKAPVPAPLLILQGGADDLVLPEIQAAYVAERCGAGQVLDYRLYPGEGHVPVTTAEAAVADLFAFTRDRFAGGSFAANCS